MENDRIIIRKEGYANVLSSFMSKVYLWMFIGLAVTAIISGITISTPALLTFIFSNTIIFWGLIIAEFVLVFSISGAINRINAQTAIALFVLYSVINGVVLSSIFLVYTRTSIVMAFATTSAMFLTMSIYGLTTKRDLTSWGSFLFMGLIGIIIAFIVNIFLKSSMMYFVISGIGVIVFTGLAAYDNQKLKNMGYNININDSSLVWKSSVLGALILYLDFINLFIMLLSLFGRRR